MCACNNLELNLQNREKLPLYFENNNLKEELITERKGLEKKFSPVCCTLQFLEVARTQIFFLNF